MTLKTLLRSFAGGEIAPELYGRLDLAKFQTGLAICRNFIVLPHGPVANRPGFEYVLEVKDSTKKTKLIPFSYSTQQTYALELGDQYMRIHTQGGTLLETGKNITGATQASLGVLTSVGHGFVVGNWVYISAVGGMTQLNGRYFKVGTVPSVDTFTLKDLAGTPIDTTPFGAYTSGGTAARVYEISTPYLEADLFDIHYVQSADVLTLVHPGYQQHELRRLGATNWQLATLAFAPTIGTPAAPTVAAGGPGGGTPVAYSYKTTAVSSDGLEESLASTAASASSDLTVAGNYINITTAAVSGAVRYNIYKLKNGLYGYVGQTDGSTLKDNNIDADTSRTPPEANDPFTSAGNYPGAVGYFEQRRFFAGTTNKPQNLWGTRSATEKNLSYSIPTRDDDSITFRIASREANTIRHIVPLSDIVLLTSGGEWRVTAANSDVLTPSTVTVRPQSYYGASNVQPVVASNTILYVQARGGRVRELTYDGQNYAYASKDISIMAPHLFGRYDITDLAYMLAPWQVLWAVRSDGTLLAMTYVPEHQVLGWHRHDTEGFFESIACVAEGSEDALYTVVKRTINGRTVRYVERLHSRNFTAQEDAFFVDSGLTYDGAAVTSIRGLWHLEGATVSILADGGVQPQRVVTNGSITLDNAASVVHIGLPIEADFKTLPLGLEMQAFGQGRPKNVNKIHLRVHESSGIWAGPDEDHLVEAKQRSTEPYGTAPALRTAEIPLMLTPSWSDTGSVFVRQRDPLPLTLLSMTAEVTLGG